MSASMFLTLAACAVTLAFVVLFYRRRPRIVSWHIAETKICVSFASKWARVQLGRILE